LKNKYAALSEAAQEKRKEAKMCSDKLTYKTKELAEATKQKAYNCPYCGKWHSTAQSAKFIQEVLNQKKPKKKKKKKRFSTEQLIAKAKLAALIRSRIK
jgi:hypothetical protein